MMSDERFEDIVRVFQVGHSIVITIPREICHKFNIKPGMHVRIINEKDKILLEVVK